MANKVILIGNLGKDPEVSYTPNGTAIAKFSLATSEKWTDKNTQQRKEETQWHRIVCFGRLAEICGEYLRKGSKIYCEGMIKYSTWDKDDGTKAYATDINMRQMEMLSSNGGTRSSGSGYSNPPGGGVPGGGPAPGGQAPGGRRLPGQPGPDDDDIPF